MDWPSSPASCHSTGPDSGRSFCASVARMTIVCHSLQYLLCQFTPDMWHVDNHSCLVKSFLCFSTQTSFRLRVSQQNASCHIEVSIERWCPCLYYACSWSSASCTLWGPGHLSIHGWWGRVSTCLAWMYLVLSLSGHYTSDTILHYFTISAK